ncbi:ABC transporter substrate-binding protein [Hamadaea tsunoensis]|uniref:ABC transporter substrate-binding protein n=1 Tax=Hamadaea tsunoensis TaxID=53368 RepID=UPI000426BEFC|nr:extracellular solute-binding protein [Hamadaea tsunoensis]
MGNTAKKTGRLVALAAAACVAMTLTACGGTSADDAKDGGGFTYWSMWREEEPQAKVLKAALDQFQKDTGITVTVQWTGRDVSKKIGPAIAANQSPDLWDQANDAIFGATAQAGQALDLSPVLAMAIPGESGTVGDVIPAKYFDMMPKDPAGSNHYVIPYEVASAGVFYNAADADLGTAMPSAPSTWDAFLAVCEALKAKSKPCVASDGGETWLNELYFDGLLNAGGVDVAKLSADKSGAAWDDPAVLKAAQQVEQLVKGGYILPGYDATKYPAQETNWALGKAAFYNNGSWVTAEVAKQVPAGWKFGSFSVPGARAADAALFGFAIPKRAKNPGPAQKFIAYFLQKSMLSGISTTAGNITPRADIPAPAELEAVQKTLSAGQVRMVFDGVAGDWQPKVLDPGYLKLWHGKTTAADFVATAKQAQISFWKTQS